MLLHVKLVSYHEIQSYHITYLENESEIQYFLSQLYF